MTPLNSKTVSMTNEEFHAPGFFNSDFKTIKDSTNAIGGGLHPRIRKSSVGKMNEANNLLLRKGNTEHLDK